MNIVVIDGRLVREPEIRYTQTGKAVADIVLAVDIGFGENKKTAFIKCEAWEKKAETIGNTLSKGRKILVKGEWMQQQWEKDGQKHTKDYCRIESFEYMDSKKEEQQSNNKQTDMSCFGSEVNIDDELCF